MNKKRLIVFSLMFVFCFSLLSASFEKGEPSHLIGSSYGAGGNITGWINISLENEESTSLFEDSFGNSIRLVDLLKLDNSLVKGEDYDCSIEDCLADYSKSNGEYSKTFNLGVGDSVIIGVDVGGEPIMSINSFEFDIESDATQSCTNQIGIDFFNDNLVDLGNTKATSVGCSQLKTYGCFDQSALTEEYFIGYHPYMHCQRVTLSKSPGFKLGAWVNPNGDTRDLTMAILDSGERVASCDLPSSSSSGEISCDVDYSVLSEKEVYVCIFSEESEGTSRIRGSSSENNCGFYGNSIRNEVASYQIFAEGRSFAPVGTINVLNNLPSYENVAQEAAIYLKEKYGDLDCSGECIIPIQIISDMDQTITINNLEVDYETELGQKVKTTMFDLVEIPSEINSGFIQINLDKGGFVVPDTYGDKKFDLELDGNLLFSEEISIDVVPEIKRLKPLIVASAIPTTFKVLLNSSSDNIEKYEWDFGSNKTYTTINNEIVYTYDSTGSYQINVKVIDNYQRSSERTFNIIVDSPERAINTTIKKLQQNLENIKEEIDSFDVFQRDVINSLLNLEENEQSLKDIQKAYLAASTNTEYTALMGQLLELEIPKSIILEKSASSLPFYPLKENIDLDILKEIGGGDYADSEKDRYVNAILGWEQLNIDSKISFKEFSVQYDDFDSHLLTTFEISLNGTGSLDEDSYIIIKDLEDLQFEENYLQNELNGYFYIDFVSTEKVIKFSTTDELDFASLPFFVSPQLGRLDISSEEILSGDGKFRVLFFILIIVLLFIFGLIIYIFLQQWYKKRYENYLFKNRNNLYNLLSYIDNSKKKEIKDKEIISKLRKAGWNSEQIDYALKKYLGKRTGMFEIPIDNVLVKLRMKKSQQNKFNSLAGKIPSRKVVNRK